MNARMLHFASGSESELNGSFNMQARRIFKRCLGSAAMAAVLTSIAAPAGAAFVSIDDVAEGMPVVTSTGCNKLAVNLGPERADVQCSYTVFGATGAALLGAGQTVFFGFNVFEPGSQTLSDRLVLSFIGKAATATSQDNIDVFVGFDSDVEGLPFPPLTGNPFFNPINIFETGGFQSLDSYINAALPLSGFSLAFRSDVASIPEPSTLAVVGLGLVGLGVTSRRRSPGRAAT